MFNNKFWPKRKSINIDKLNTQDKTKSIIVNSNEENDENDYKKSKKIDKNTSLFNKIRKSFIKAKSIDNCDVLSNKKSISQHKNSFDNLIGRGEPIKSQKINIISIKRIFTSTKSKSIIVKPSIIDQLSSKTINSVKIDNKIPNKSIEWTKCSQKRAEKLILSGIVNHGNTCYINSVIQCLNSIDSLVKYFICGNQYEINDFSSTVIDSSDSFSLLLSFSSLLKSLWIKNLNCAVLSNDFKLKLAETEASFCCNDQQDAQEFLLFLLNYCHERLKLKTIDNLTCSSLLLSSSSCVNQGENRGGGRLTNKSLSSSKENEESIIYKLFVTRQQLTISCPGCNSRQHKLESHLCLSLPVPAKTMEPLYYCFIEKDGSQICAAMWINTVSLVQYVRANIAHKFRIDVNRVIIMVINEAGFGKCFQDSEQAVDLLLSDNITQTVSNLWNGIVALEIPSIMSNSSCREYNFSESKIYQKSIKQMKNSTSPIRRTYSSGAAVVNRHSGNYDNFTFEEQKTFESQKSREETNSNSHSCYEDTPYQRSNATYSDNSGNNTAGTAGLPINLVIIHVEENIEKTYGSTWRRFSAPVSLLVRKEIEFKDLETMVIAQLEGVYHCNLQSKLKSHLRFWVWDGLSNIEAEITSDHQFPLLTEVVESIISWSEETSIIRIVTVWSPSNSARLMQTVFANLRLSHSLGREFSRSEIHNGRSDCASLTLMDAWSSIEENGSVELVMRATLSKRSHTSDSRNISLEDCLKAYVSEEILDAKDAWKCPNCHKFQRATISNSIYSLPDILVLHLKRFQSYSLTFNNNEGKPCRDHEDIALTTVGGNNSNSHNGSLLFENNSNNKLNILVDYPLSGLDMRSYLSAEAMKNCQKKVDSNEYYYDLIAVCNHQGTLSTGHYTAFCRSSVDYRWRLFNDDVVREVLADKVIQPNAYILFYQRRSSIVSQDQHWSVALNPPKPEKSPNNSSSLSFNATQSSSSDLRKISNVNKVTDMKQFQRKSDPPIRRVPYRNKKVTDLKVSGDTKTILQYPSLHRPLPLDNNCNSIRNNTPIVDDDDEEEDDNDDGTTTSQGSTSYDEYIPASITKRPLRLQYKKNTDNNQSNFPNSKSH